MAGMKNPKHAQADPHTAAPDDAEALIQRELEPGAFPGCAGPADDATTPKIEDRGQIQPAFAGLDVGDVGHPHLVGTGRRRQLRETIGRRGLSMSAVGGVGLAATTTSALQAQRLEQTGAPALARPHMILPDSADELRHRHLDGILVVGEYPALRSVLEELVRHTPVVLTDDFSPFADSGWVVRSDEHEAGRLAAARFASVGRRRPGFIGSWGAQDRAGLAGFREGLLAAGVECREELFCLRQPDETFYGAVSRVVRAGADALFVPGSNYEAMEAYSVVANVLRLRVPSDVALIGGEVHGVSKFLTPPMTTVSAPLADVAALAVETLASLMRGEKPPRTNTLPVRLVARESA